MDCAESIFLCAIGTAFGEKSTSIDQGLAFRVTQNEGYSGAVDAPGVTQTMILRHLGYLFHDFVSGKKPKLHLSPSFRRAFLFFILEQICLTCGREETPTMQAFEPAGVPFFIRRYS